MLTGIATAGTRVVQKVEPNPVVLKSCFGERWREHHLLFFSSISPTSLFRSLLYRLSRRLSRLRKGRKKKKSINSTGIQGLS